MYTAVRKRYTIGMNVSEKKIAVFKKTIWQYYKKHKRNLQWRERIEPYHVFVSEIMLQQTQVPRVMTKFPEFIKTFPDFKSLAEASTSKLLKTWQGMGYNRRALYLRDAAKTIVVKHNGKVSLDPEELESLPGIGKATGRSIATFIGNKPEVFIETNIRRTFIHHFFKDKTEVGDKEIIVLVEETLDRQNPREWYYALMDYGSALSKKIENPNRKSKHYIKQKSFSGSDRQVRGMLLRLLLKSPSTAVELKKQSGFTQEKIICNLGNLMREGFIMERRGKYIIK